MISPHVTDADFLYSQSSPSVHIVIVNWNGLADTCECLTSLAGIDYPNAQVIVVDNGSRGDEAASLRSAFPAVTVLETGENLGFTGGNNVGIKHALAKGADYVLCLNNDTVVAPDFLGLLVAALEADPKAGIATSAIYYYDQPEKISALGNWVDLSDTTPAGHINAEHEDKEPTLRELHGDVVLVPAVSGCVLLMRRAIAERTGGFDIGLFAYMEDIDLCLRAKRQGWHCLAVRPSHVWHKIGSASGGEYSSIASHYFTRNSYHLMSRYGSAAQKSAFRKQQNLSRLAKLDFYMTTVRRRERTSQEDADKTRQALDFAVNTYIGALGCQGRRESYAALEQALRRWIILSTPVLKMPLSLYMRAHWKLWSLRRA